MFQIEHRHTKNRVDQTPNIDVHYDQPDVDASYEVANAEMCGHFKEQLFRDGISVQFQAYPAEWHGLPYKRTFHSFIETIDDIAPLAAPGAPALIAGDELP